MWPLSFARSFPVSGSRSLICAAELAAGQRLAFGRNRDAASAGDAAVSRQQFAARYVPDLDLTGQPEPRTGRDKMLALGGKRQGCHLLVDIYGGDGDGGRRRRARTAGGGAALGASAG